MMEEVRECLIVNQEIPKFQVWKIDKTSKILVTAEPKGNSRESTEQEKSSWQIGERELHKP